MPFISAGEGETATEAEEGTNSSGVLLSLLEDLIGRYVWDGHPIETHPHAYEREMVSVLAILKTLSPVVGDKLQIDTSSINKHPGFQKVLNNHTRGSACMRQYFKNPLEYVALPFECIACSKGLFSPSGMPLDA